jgi:hypothetical protein
LKWALPKALKCQWITWIICWQPYRRNYNKEIVNSIDKGNAE